MHRWPQPACHPPPPPATAPHDSRPHNGPILAHAGFPQVRAALHELAETRRERELARCVDDYREALSLAEVVGDTQAAATCAFNLGNAFKNLPQIRDLSLAEQWYYRSLELRATEDRIGRARSLNQLGSVVYERFRAARN